MRLSFIMMLALVTVFSAGTASAKDFSSWLTELQNEARAKGISSATISQALPASLKPIPRIVELDRKQPEKTKTLEQYLTGAVSQKRVDGGRAQMAEYKTLLQNVSDAFGVQKEVIVALWGVETSYGSNTGGFDIVTALATLAYDGRRSAFFREELFNALRILDEEHISHHKMKGSWAGAMGQCQFMPSSFLRFAVDFNKDGKRDIWGTQADVFASTANYLSQSGWKKNEPWGHQVQLPSGFDRNLIGTSIRRSLQAWHDAGVRMLGGKSIPFEGALEASIIQPDGAGTPAFVVYDNYRVILKWNKSNYFATSVGLLSDRLKGW